MQELDEALAGAGDGKIVIVFSALTWCRPCKGMQRPAHKLAERYKDSTVWMKLFGNANEQTKTLFKDRLKIRSTPSFIIFKDGEVAYTQTGTNKEKLEAGIREVLGADHPKLPQELVYPATA
ncbi:thioredoxin-like protein [Dunaliella salina]|uniref:Thioredoxin-like protein n=1 Tax=Dunaliella salina TaxID=3046 RepID=A0ABQ7GH84_DUNSA|nr:thioredoxin-like protein [Dunaliella salina]|eukprot:KAF5833967.1 thioredoxin-like protein [Dunaliella salina]